MGKGGVEGFAVLHLPPHLGEIVRKGCPHGLEGLAKLPQLVVAGAADGKIQVVVGYFFRGLPQRRQGFFQPVPIKQHGGGNDAAGGIHRDRHRGNQFQKSDGVFIFFGKRNRFRPDVGALSQAFPLFIGQIIFFAGGRIGRPDALGGTIAKGKGGRGKNHRQCGKGHHIENQAFSQGQILSMPVHLTHLYPHPQIVSMYAQWVYAAILARILRICSATTLLSPWLSYPQMRS